MAVMVTVRDDRATEGAPMLGRFSWPGDPEEIAKRLIHMASSRVFGRPNRVVLDMRIDPEGKISATAKAYGGKGVHKNAVASQLTAEAVVS